MRAALFITCFNDTLFPQVGVSTVQLLERLGVAVDFPQAQTCCGQMHYNTGYQKEALPLVRHFVETFGDAEIIVAPSASCVGMVRDLYPRAAAEHGDAALVKAESAPWSPFRPLARRISPTPLSASVFYMRASYRHTASVPGFGAADGNDAGMDFAWDLECQAVEWRELLDLMQKHSAGTSRTSV